MKSVGQLEQRGDAHFRKRERIRLDRDFQYTRDRAVRIMGRYMIAKVAMSPDHSVRIGIIVSRKYDKRAVARNRARRCMREAFRLVKSDIEPAVWLVLIARHAMHSRKTQEIQADLVAILQKAGVFCNP